MGRIYDESLTDSTLAFKASEPGTIRYQIDGTASYASAAAMDAASGSAEVTGTISAAAGNGTRDIDVSGLTSGLWYIHLVNNDGTPVSVSFTKIASNVVFVGVGSLQITGNRATIVYDRNVLAQAAGLTLTSHPATVSVGANTVVAAGAASLVITAHGATITLDRNIAAAVASLTLTSFAATITNPASGGFTPADLFASSEKGVWLDPSDLSTLWQDTAGTTPITADGQAVARIDDKSGNGFNAVMATAANRPLYKTAGGLHWLEFDNVNDNLFAPLIYGSNSGDTTVCAAQSYSTTTQHYANATNTVIGSAGRNGNYGAWAGGWVESTTALGSTVVSTYEVDNGTNALLRINGSQEATGGTAGRVYNNTGFNFCSTTGNLKSYGLMIINRLLTGTETSDTEAYMAAKSGVTL